MRANILRTYCLTAASLYAGSVAGLEWTPPAGWTSTGATSMRAATYKPAGNAECVIYFFGVGQGGTVQANLDRWKGQFKGADSKPADAKIGKLTVHGLPITTVDVSGEYSGMGGPTAPTPAVPVKDYRLLGAIIEGPGGNIFIKFTGPAAAIAASRPQFEQMLQSFKPGS